MVPVVRLRADGVDSEIDAPEAPPIVGSSVQVPTTRRALRHRAVERVPKIGCSIMLLAAGVVVASGASPADGCYSDLDLNSVNPRED
jgi:hypothetical protein